MAPNWHSFRSEQPPAVCQSRTSSAWATYELTHHRTSFVFGARSVDEQMVEDLTAVRKLGNNLRMGPRCRLGCDSRSVRSRTAVLPQPLACPAASVTWLCWCWAATAQRARGRSTCSARSRFPNGPVGRPPHRTVPPSPAEPSAAQRRAEPSRAASAVARAPVALVRALRAGPSLGVPIDT